MPISSRSCRSSGRSSPVARRSGAGLGVGLVAAGDFAVFGDPATCFALEAALLWRFGWKSSVLEGLLEAAPGEPAVFLFFLGVSSWSDEDPSGSQAGASGSVTSGPVRSESRNFSVSIRFTCFVTRAFLEGVAFSGTRTLDSSV